MPNNKFTEAIEKKYGVRHVGYYDVPVAKIIGGEKRWAEKVQYNTLVTADVFYQENPDVSKGHSHYLGVRTDGDATIFLFDAEGIERAIFKAIQVPGKGAIVSRYRHDFATFDGERDGPFIDGGLNYSRYHADHPPTHHMRVVDGKETFEPVKFVKTEPVARKPAAPQSAGDRKDEIAKALKVANECLATSAEFDQWSDNGLYEAVKTLASVAPKKATVPCGVSVFIIKDGKFLVVRRQGSHAAGTLGLPGGSIDPGETAAQAACREVLEEVGISIDPVDLKPLHWNDYFDTHEGKPIQWITLAFLATKWAGTPQVMDEKASELLWIDAKHDGAELMPCLADFLTKFGQPQAE